MRTESLATSYRLIKCYRFVNYFFQNYLNLASQFSPGTMLSLSFGTPVQVKDVNLYLPTNPRKTCYYHSLDPEYLNT